jgi:hypothetical protein
MDQILYWFLIGLVVIIGAALLYGGFTLIKAAISDDTQPIADRKSNPKRKGPSTSRRPEKRTEKLRNKAFQTS